MHPSSGPPQPGPFHVPPVPPPPRRSSRFPLWLAVVAVLLSTAALIVAVLGLTREPEQKVEPPASSVATTDSNDRALCEAIAPLIKESSGNKNDFVELGEPGSPERNAGIPNFVEITQDWVSRAQEVLDAHAEPPRYLTRTLQRYVDDMRLFVDGLRPGPEDDADRALWTDSIGALGGPLTTCLDQGVELWQR